MRLVIMRDADTSDRRILYDSATVTPMRTVNQVCVSDITYLFTLLEGTTPNNDDQRTGKSKHSQTQRTKNGRRQI
jgi:hypothetical protein